ncbi:centrosomal protein CCDC61-like [Patiria miniata]|uniref:Centrosomal protein CCDC61 n=1 Tax=Patiria miniata TaxID=46514 RepID=A0A914BG41_PATMI|nr:centrosomal protein CCDC61-like [Patiria miniata]XP_038075060.1 centrosomal protein CCDC61-like [Patiria miniata]
MGEREGDAATMAGPYTFRGMDYVVSMWLDEDNDTLTVEVEDRLTADQWRGTFDAAYIEDLTHKTGNFKQFSIFTSMLESAINKTSESVTLDLLTYADLETLRSRKAGGVRSSIPGAQKVSLSAKRYLIVTYTVEFDRIHYPLPLPYQGKPDPVALQETVRELKREVRRLQSQVHSDYRSNELQRLKKDYEELLKEKQNLDDEFLQYRREVKNTTKGSAAKEVRVLKTVIRNLEEELMNERRKFQRSASKRNQDYKNLIEEVEELRASERNLRVRVKSLVNELAVLKSSSRRVSRSPTIPLPSSQGTASRRSLGTQERARLAGRDASRERARLSSRERAASRERRRPASVSSMGSRSPSPAGARVPRFDPTAYNQEKKRQQDEAKARRERRRSRTLSSGSQPSRSQERGRTRTRPSPSYPAYQRPRSRSNSSVGSRGSRVSTSGLSDIDAFPDSSQKRTRVLNNVRKQRRTVSTAWNSPNAGFRRAGSTGKPKRMMSTPDPYLNPDRAHRVANQVKVRQKDLQDYGVRDQSMGMYNRSSEMSEIDARLSALQKLMSNIPK